MHQVSGLLGWTEESEFDSMKIDFKMSFVCEVYLFCLAWFFEIHGLEIEIMSFLF